MKTLSLIVLVLGFTFTTPATAADKDGQYSTQASASCGQWAKYREEGGWRYTATQGWIMGYISAYNEKKSDVYDILGKNDPDSIWLWMNKYCQENPLSDVPEGMMILTDELWPNRKRTKDD